jgi:hypothetical protein
MAEGKADHKSIDKRRHKPWLIGTILAQRLAGCTYS